MAIPSRQIGWSTTDNLLWEISKQLQYLTQVIANPPASTTSTTTLTTNQYFQLRSCLDNNIYYSKDYPFGTFSDIGEPRVTGLLDSVLTTFFIEATVNNSVNPTGIEITATGSFGCP